MNNALAIAALIAMVFWLFAGFEGLLFLVQIIGCLVAVLFVAGIGSWMLGR